jgi:hypothetical protein
MCYPISTMVIVPTIMPLPKVKFTQAFDIPPVRVLVAFNWLNILALFSVPKLCIVLKYPVTLRSVTAYVDLPLGSGTRKKDDTHTRHPLQSNKGFHSQRQSDCCHL